MPDYGQTISKGVKYLQINRLDEDGEDFNQRLALADSIRINHPDIGPVQYNILTTQQQGDSYLMGIIPQEATSSEGRFGFSLDANKVYNTSLPLANPCFSVDSGPGFLTDYFFGMGTGGTATGDATAFYSAGSATIRSSSYEFRRSSNEQLSLFFSCSIINGDTDNHNLDVKLIIENSEGQTVINDTLFTLNCIASSTSTEEITYQLPDYYTKQGNILRIFGDANGGPLSASEAGFSIIADPIDTPPDVLINISPEQSNFQWSDYNAVFGNTSDPQFSDIFMGVDYSSNYITPINFNLIISGSAPKASVQDSNYTQAGWSNGRYDGSRNSSTDFNQ
jgi:hypothetical protein